MRLTLGASTNSFYSLLLFLNAAKILFGVLAAAPSDCKLQVYGHGLDGAAAMRAANAKRKDYLSAQLKCTDCKTIYF